MTLKHTLLLPGTTSAQGGQITLGVMGGGQLGRMFVHAAQRLGYFTAVLDPDPQSPAGLVSHHHIQTGYSDAQGLAQAHRFDHAPARAPQPARRHQPPEQASTGQCEQHQQAAAGGIDREV
ncbi:MAG: hypothetical protein Q7U45_07155, partial [Burkholderiaceae bacterium]|nr:hypothetical protein [Burkholderiaceae bacterium]